MISLGCLVACCYCGCSCYAGCRLQWQLRAHNLLSLYHKVHVEVQRLKKGYLQDESGVGSDAVMVGLGRIGRDGQICNAVKRRVTTR